MEKTQKGISALGIHIGIVIALLVAGVSALTMAGNIIDYLVAPEHMDWHTFRYAVLEGLPEQAAFLAVSFSVLVLLSRKIRSFATEYRNTVWFSIRHALIVGILAVAVATGVIAIAMAISDILAGDLPPERGFKTIFTAGVGAMVFYYYRGVLRDTWKTNAPEERRFVVSVIALIALLTVTAMVIVNPLDRKALDRTSETLRSISVVEDDIDQFFKQNGYVPATLDDVGPGDGTRERHQREDPNDRLSYKKTGTASYQLCASFDALPERTDLPGYPYGHLEVERIGETCFALTATGGD